MRCDSIYSDNDSDDGSDEEIRLLRKKISERRSRRKFEKQLLTSAFSDPSDTGKSSSFKTSSTVSSSLCSSTTGEYLFLIFMYFVHLILK